MKRAALHNLRQAAGVAAGRPAWGAGVRAAIATVAPLVAATALGLSGGTWMTLSGFNGALSDRGGPYRTRALTLVLLTVATAVVVVAATFVHGHVLAAVPVTLAVGVLCSLARVWGSAGAGAATAVLCTYLIALPIPVRSPDEWIVRALYILAGGAWAMLLSLVFWPLRPYRPVRLAVSRCYRAASDYLLDIARQAQAGGTPDVWKLRGRAVALRGAIEQARETLAVTRRGRPAESDRGERLLVLHEIVDQIFGHALAITDALETGAPAASRADTLAAVGATFAAAAAASREIADAVATEHGGVAPRLLLGTVRDEHADPLVAELLDRVMQYAQVAASTAGALNGAVPDDGERAPIDLPERALRGSFGDAVGAILAPGEVLVRHAWRVGVAAAAAVWLAAALHLPHDYWMTITVVIILQPYTAATSQKALQRVAGTLVGAGLAAVLAAAVHDPRAVLVVTFAFVALCVALLPVNYAAYSVFLTPAFVLLAEVTAGEWHLGRYRLLDTVIGATIALVAARVLWPRSDWERLPDYMAAALRANRDYLRLVVERIEDASARSGAILRRARRDVAIAAENVEEAFQRALGERREADAAVEAGMTFVVYTRRFAVSVAALAVAGHATASIVAAQLEGFTGACLRVFDDLAAAVRERRRPAPFPAIGSVALPAAGTTPVLYQRTSRLARQLKSLHGAVDHWAADAGGEELRRSSPPSEASAAPSR